MAFAADVDVAQRPDLEVMKVFLVQCNSNSDTGAVQDGQGGSVPGAVDDATITRLKSSSGTELDELWLQSMIRRQQAAIDVAGVAIARGANVDVITTARQFAGRYQAQVARMKQLLAS